MEGTIEEQIQTQTDYVTAIKNSLADAQQANDTYQQQVLQSQLDTEKQKLTNLVNSLVEQTSTIQELTPEQIEAWKNIANTSLTEYNNGLMRLPEETRNKIQDATGVIVADTGLSSAAGTQGNNATMLFSQNLKLADQTGAQISSSSESLKNDTTVPDEAKNLADRAQTKFEENDSKTWGEDLIEGIGNGIKGKSESHWFNGILAGAASTIASFLHFSKPDQGPLREYEKWMPDMIEGLANSLDNKSYKLLNSAKKLSNNLYRELDFSNISGKVNSKIIERTQTIYTTPNLNIYTQGEVNIRKIADEVNRIFGSKY